MESYCLKCKKHTKNINPQVSSTSNDKFSTSWVSNIGDLVLVLIFWFRIIACGWLWVIASNFLKIRNGWAIVVKYATTIVYVGTHFFHQFLETSRSHSNAYNNVISSENHGPIKWERDWWFYR